MKLDDIEIIPTYNEHGEITHLDIRCKRTISINKFCSDYSKLKVRFHTCHYVQNVDDETDIVGMDFMCDPKYSFFCFDGPKNNMLRVLALERDSKLKTKLL